MSYQEGRDYFEKGCVCVLSGRIPATGWVSAEKAFDYYMNTCTCSRHPNSLNMTCWDRELSKEDHIALRKQCIANLEKL